MSDDIDFTRLQRHGPYRSLSEQIGEQDRARAVLEFQQRVLEVLATPEGQAAVLAAIGQGKVQP